jgi:hypothetical protein
LLAFSLWLTSLLVGHDIAVVAIVAGVPDAVKASVLLLAAMVFLLQPCRCRFLRFFCCRPSVESLLLLVSLLQLSLLPADGPDVAGIPVCFPFFCKRAPAVSVLLLASLLLLGSLLFLVSHFC